MDLVCRSPLHTCGFSLCRSYVSCFVQKTLFPCNHPLPLTSENLSTLSSETVAESLEDEVWHKCPASDWAIYSISFSTSWLLVGLCLNCYLLPNKVFLMGVGKCINLWIEHQESLGISLRLPPASRIRVVRSPPMMTYQATGSCYGLELDAILANGVHS